MIGDGNTNLQCDHKYREYAFYFAIENCTKYQKHNSFLWLPRCSQKKTFLSSISEYVADLFDASNSANGFCQPGT